VEHAAVEGHDVAAKAAVLLVAAHDPLQPALEHADDPALRALGGHALHAGHHPVAVQGLLQVDGGDVDVALAFPAPLGHHEPVAGGVAGEPAHDEVHLRGQADPRAPDLDQLPVLDEPSQDALQLAAAGGIEGQALHQLAHGDGLSFLAEQIEDAVVQVGHHILILVRNGARERAAPGSPRRGAEGGKRLPGAEGGAGGGT
jgi:hypothetical protein